MCAGPYSQALLGIDSALSAALQAQLVKKEDNEVLRPGYTRVSLPYFADAATVRYVLDALLFVAEHGWKLLPQYTCDAASGEWRLRPPQHRPPQHRPPSTARLSTARQAPPRKGGREGPRWPELTRDCPRVGTSTRSGPRARGSAA